MSDASGIGRLSGGWIAVLVYLWAGPAAGQVETFDYTVEQGDTCESIAEEFYDHERGCDLIKKYNTEDGEGPDFTAGEVLQLPTKVAKAEARLDRKHGSVRAREPDRNWHSAVVGEELYRTWRVNTLEAARARLSFRDRSRLKMRQQTLIIIYGGSRKKVERRRKRARLQKGKLRSRLAELSGGESVRLETPSSRSEMTGGNVFFDVREDGTTRVANHGGGPVEVSGKGSASARKTVTVKEGMGTKIEQGRPPSPPEQLPPAPTWATTRTDVLSFGGSSVPLVAEWKPVDAAAEYFVELAADPEGIEILKSAYVPSKVTRLAVDEAPPGTYYATVSTIDSDEFEGIPSERLELHVWEVDHPETARLEGNETPTFVVGAKLSFPDEVRCHLGGGEPRATLRLGVPGDHELECVAGDERTVEPRNLRVARPDVSVGGPGLSGGEIRVSRGRFALADLTFEPRAPDEISVSVEAEGDETAIDVRRTPVTRKRIRLRVSAARGAPKRAELVVRAGEGLELARVPVVTRGSESRAERRTARRNEPEFVRSVRLGLGLGAAGLPARSVGYAWPAGGRLVVSYLHNPAFAVEAVAGLGWSRGRFGMAGRIRGTGRIPGERWSPYAAGSFGLGGPLGAAAAPFVGTTVGTEFEFAERWTFRGGIGTDLLVGPAGGVRLAPRVAVGLLFEVP